MTYAPIVARLQDVHLIPGADRIVSATASGYRVIVGSDRRPGDLGVVFPADGVLDLRFAQAAGLLARDPDTNAKLGGHLDDPPVVRCLTLRGVRSEALWLPMDKFLEAVAVRAGAVTPDLDALERLLTEGEEVPGFPFGGPDGSHWVVARKYTVERPAKAKRDRLTSGVRAVRSARAKVVETADHAKVEIDAAMPEHYDTPSAQRGLYRAPYGAVVYATQKLHGTSGRTARRRLPLSRLQRVANVLASLVRRSKPYPDSEVVAGTRRSLVDPDDAGYRAAIRDWLGERLRPGECVYYEIVGYTDTGKAIQTQRVKAKGVDGKAIVDQFGTSIVYHYGCDPDGEPVAPGRPYPHVGPAHRPQQRVFAYRITQDGRDLPLEEVRRRAVEIGVEVPALFDKFRHVARTPVSLDQLAPPTPRSEGESFSPALMAEITKEQVERVDQARRRQATVDTLAAARDYAEGPTGVRVDPLAAHAAPHPLEGVVLRVEPHEGSGAHQAFKVKAYGFGVAEGQTKDEARASGKPSGDTEEAEDARGEDDAS